MSRAVCVVLTCLSATSLVAGCASAPVQTASGYAGTGANAIYRTGSDVYAGVGTAAKRPFQDLNMMQDPIPMVLLRAEQDPYAVKGLSSCDVVMNRVAELDLALGPDLDSPMDHPKSKVNEDAGLASAAALEAAAAAAEGFMPVRSVVKMVSGANKYEKHVKHAVLAGTERRTFLKAIGVMHNCGWPAAPLTLTAEDAKVVTMWGPAAVAASLNAGGAAVVSLPGIAPVQAPQVQSAQIKGVAVQAPALAQMTSMGQSAPPEFSAPSVQTAALSPPRSAPMSGARSAALQPTPQPVAAPAALVGSPPTTPASPTIYPIAAPYPGAAPWASQPPGGR